MHGIDKNSIRRNGLRRMSASITLMISELEREHREFEASGALEYAESADLAIGQLSDALQALEWAQELIGEITPPHIRRTGSRHR